MLLVAASPAEDSSWVGCHRGEGARLRDHARAAVEGAAARGAALVFSGAPTEGAAGDLSEAASYRGMAEHAGYWASSLPEQRVLVEEFALDSLQNLLYSIALFRLTFGAYPAEVTVFGWGFKSERFRRHAEAIGWTRAFEYVAVNDPSPGGGALERARAGEAAKCRALEADPLLVGTRWIEERRRRNHTLQREPYTEQLAELALLASGTGVLPTW